MKDIVSRLVDDCARQSTAPSDYWRVETSLFSLVLLASAAGVVTALLRTQITLTASLAFRSRPIAVLAK